MRASRAGGTSCTPTAHRTCCGPPTRRALAARSRKSASTASAATDVPDILVLRTEQMPGPLLDDVRSLVFSAFVATFTDDDWEHALGGWHVIALEDDMPVAHAAVVRREIHIGDASVDTGYLEAVATAPARQRTGLGSAVTRCADELIQERFELGCLSTSRHAFYETLGWERWRGPSYVRTADGLVRSADEDDGLMVLRCSPTADLNLT